jgi:hypothetical protein
MRRGESKPHYAVFDCCVDWAAGTFPLQLGEKLVASYLYQVHLYHWLETNDYGRFLTDNAF